MYIMSLARNNVMSPQVLIEKYNLQDHLSRQSIARVSGFQLHWDYIYGSVSINLCVFGMHHPVAPFTNMV